MGNSDHKTCHCAQKNTVLKVISFNVEISKLSQPPPQRWKKLIKQQTQNFESEKLAQKIFAKNAHNHANFAKMPKIAKKAKNL